ncbi:hypothetical protein TI39_contig358g00012 [Zymoseptoria brevis]|uniref:Uncharacterized protein n=1 Tax=Zymoseptoria brevis TaxID=1047168 RepID=A0A0F4GTC1_9PEZI|nr:hypothetical protein TI39_contig358g00012 [Zymoseptoria brevis]
MAPNAAKALRQAGVAQNQTTLGAPSAFTRHNEAAAKFMDANVALARRKQPGNEDPSATPNSPMIDSRALDKMTIAELQDFVVQNDTSLKLDSTTAIDILQKLEAADKNTADAVLSGQKRLETVFEIGQKKETEILRSKADSNVQRLTEADAAVGEHRTQESNSQMVILKGERDTYKERIRVLMPLLLETGSDETTVAMHEQVVAMRQERDAALAERAKIAEERDAYREALKKAVPLLEEIDNERRNAGQKRGRRNKLNQFVKLPRNMFLEVGDALKEDLSAVSSQQHARRRLRFGEQFRSSAPGRGTARPSSRLHAGQAQWARLPPEMCTPVVTVAPTPVIKAPSATPTKGKAPANVRGAKGSTKARGKPARRSRDLMRSSDSDEQPWVAPKMNDDGDGDGDDEEDEVNSPKRPRSAPKTPKKQTAKKGGYPTPNTSGKVKADQKRMDGQVWAKFNDGTDDVELDSAETMASIIRGANIFGGLKGGKADEELIHRAYDEVLAIRNAGEPAFRVQNTNAWKKVIAFAIKDPSPHYTGPNPPTPSTIGGAGAGSQARMEQRSPSVKNDAWKSILADAGMGNLFSSSSDEAKGEKD